MGFNQCNLRQHLPFQIHAYEASGSEEDDFNIFCVFLWFKPRMSIFNSGGHFVHQSGIWYRVI